MAVDALQNVDGALTAVGRLSLWRGVFARMGWARMLDTHGPLAAQADRAGGQGTALLGAQRLQAPQPRDQVEPGAEDAGGEVVVGRLPALLNADRWGRVAAILGPHAPVLQGAMARQMTAALPISLAPMQGERTTISLEGAYAEAFATPASPPEGRHRRDAQEGHGRATTASTVGLTVAHEGHGPGPIDDDGLDGQASGDAVTRAHVTPLTPQLQLDRRIRLNDRGGQRAKILAHALAHGGPTSAAIPVTKGRQPLVSEALVSGAALRALASGPISQPPTDPARREGYRAFERPSQGPDKNRRSPWRRMVVKREGPLRRAQQARQNQRARMEEGLTRLQARVGNPRGTQKRIRHGRMKALPWSPERRFDTVTGVGVGTDAKELRVEVALEKVREEPLRDGL